jgi:protein SEY1
LIPLLSRFRLSRTSAPPPLDAWIGNAPSSVSPADEEDLVPIGGVDEDEGKSLEEEMTILSDAKQQDLSVRFKKMADGVYVEAKRGALGGVTQVPLYFYVLLLVLGWNEIMAGMWLSCIFAPFAVHEISVLTRLVVLRNPVYFIFLILLGSGAYVTYTLNLWGPMMRMTNAASAQALEIGKERLREFLESSDTGRQAMAMSGNSTSGGRRRDYDEISMETLNGDGKRANHTGQEDDLDDI